MDTARSGTAIVGDVPSFDLFEQRYRAWLDAYLRDFSEASEMEILRGELVASVNAIYQDSFT